MYNSIIYDFLKINRKKTNRSLSWSVICLMFLTLTTMMSVNAQNDYCVPTYTGGCINGSKITKFEINNALVNFFNETGTSTCGDNDFTAVYSAIIIEGSIPSFTVRVGNNTCGIKLWIDWNQNQEFEYNELVAATTNVTGLGGSGSFTKNIYVPAGVLPGDYRIRVRTVDDSTTFTACSTQDYGEVEDYTLRIISPPTCLPPTDLTANSTDLLSNVELSWTSFGTLFDVEWGEKDFILGTGTQINGITQTSTLISVDIDIPYQFYVRRHCGNDLSVWQGPFNFEASYCVPTYTVGCEEVRIGNFEISQAIINLTNNTGNVCLSAYNNFSSISATATVGLNPYFSVEPALGQQRIKLWIDWNMNGIFEENELIADSYGVISVGNLFKGFINIPENTPIGDYRLRVRSSRDGNDFTACSNRYSGETEDYTLKIVDPPSCLQPTLLGFTPTSLTNAILTWTSSASSFDVEWGEYGFDLGNGTQINGITTTSVPVTTTENIQYQFYVRQHCSDNNISAWTGPFTFETGYCKLAYSDGCVDIFSKITNFEITDVIENLYNNSGEGQDSCGANGYSDFTSLYATASEDITASFFIEVEYPSRMKMWIDWNQNGIFEANELISQSELITSFEPFSGIINIPENTPIGDYRLRVRVINQNDQSEFDACNVKGLGEIEDYTFKVVAPLSCSPPIDVMSTQVSATSFELSWTSSGNLFDVEWGTEGFDLGNGTQINGITQNSTTVTGNINTSYEFYVRHDCGNNDFSIWRGPYKFRTGYCIPIYTTECDWFTSKITNFEINDAFANLSNDTGTTCPVDSYSDFSDMIAMVNEGSTVSFVVNVNLGLGVRIWVDWNNNGIFDIDELVAQTFTGTFVIPVGVPAGDYRLRVRVVRSETNFTACSTQVDGQVEDYTLRVIASDNCLPPSNLSFTQNSLTDVNFSWTAYNSTSFDVEWGEYGFVLGNGTQINGITTNSIPLTVSSDTLYQFYVRRNCGGGNLSTWAGPFNFKTDYCTPIYNFGCNNGAKISKFEINAALTNLSNNTGTVCGVGGYNDFTSITATSFAGQTISSSTSVASFSGGVKIWVDWNNNGFFETDELVAQSTTNVASGNTFTSAFTVPSDALLGNYRMRVRVVEGSTNFTACSTQGYGETEDYTLIIVSPPSCITPDSLTYTQNSMTNATISWTSNGNLFDVEWGEEGFVLGNGTQINGITSTSVNVNTTIDTQYEFYVRQNCGNSDFSTWAGPFSFKTGYCTPIYIIGCNGGSKIRNFEINDAVINLANNTGASSCGANGYDNFTYMSATAYQGLILSFKVQLGSNAGGIKIWVDWNDNGLFETSELIGESNMNIAPTSMFTGTFSVPEGTPSGDYRIRVRAVQNSSNFNACSSHNRGETEDYTLTVVAPPSCSPPIILTETATSLNSVILGWTSNGNLFDVEWGEEGFSLGNGTQIDEIDTNSVSVNINIDTPYEFYVRQNCGSGTFSQWAGPLSFKTGYCPPIYTNGCTGIGSKISNFEINNVFVNLANNTGTDTCGDNGYNNFTTMSASAFENQIVSFIVGIGSSQSGVKIWIDWNNNGFFEENELVAESNENIVANSNFTGTFIIPQGIPLGDYRLRVRAVRNVPTNFTACSSQGYGETEDYTIKVVSQQSCTIPINHTVTINSLTNVTLGWISDGNLFDVEWGVAGFTLGNGTQINGINSTSTSINVTLDVLYEFYVRQNCGSGNFSTWNGPFSFRTSNYCIPIHSPTSCFKISYFYMEAITNIYNTTDVVCGGSGYNDFTSIVAEVSEGFIPSFVVTVDSGGMASYNGGVKIWVDWNQNGQFEESELVASSSTIIYAEASFAGIFYIPANIPLGDYRLRVRAVRDTTSFDACSLHPTGEIEDYTLRIVAPPNCLPTFLPTATNISATSVLLQWTSSGNLFDIEYGQAGFTQGSGTLITEVSNPYTLTEITPGVQYDYYVRQNCGSGDFSDWNGPITFTSGVYQEKISTMFNTNPQVTDVACGATLNIDVPAGKQIASLKVEYTMTSASPRFISEQRSVLYSPTLNAGENTVVSGNSSENYPGVQGYNRSVDFANGATGTVVFELKAWRVAGSSGCADDEIFIVNGTWILTPTFEEVPVCSNPPTNLGYNVISENSVELFWSAGESGAT